MVCENNSSDPETWSIPWIHVEFTSILHSHTPFLTRANLERLRLFHRWECLKCNDHMLSVWRLKDNDHCNVRAPISRKGGAIQVHFTHEGEGLKAQRRLHGWKVYMESYMADYELGFMVYRNLRQTYLQEVGLTQISGDHDLKKKIPTWQIAWQISVWISRQISY